MADAPLTLGTAGHIDHGKTALVRALTGRDTDRLPEERDRGISIELGYAQLRLPSGRMLSVVDVPGHERFVRTMVAGATGIDLFLMCIAADDGVMPQTREHLAVLRHLGVERGVVAITKSDIADPELALAEAAELLPGIEAVPVAALRGERIEPPSAGALRGERIEPPSAGALRGEEIERPLAGALPGNGLEELRAALDRVAAAVVSRSAEAEAPARLHVDRSFSLKGIGTVVTGTLWSGSIAPGDQVEILPAGRRVRVRSVQVHDLQVERAAAGQRVALNLAGIGRGEVGRGDVVVSGGWVAPAHIVDVRIELEAGEPPVASGARLHVHHATRESPGRIYPLGAGFAQLRLESPIVAARGDRVILRQLAPPDTIGGGTVVETPARRHGPSDAVIERLEAIVAGADPDADAGADADSSPRRDPDRGASGDAPGPDPTAAARARAADDPDARALAALLREDGTQPRTDAELGVAAGLDPGSAARAFRILESAGVATRVARNLHFDSQALGRLVDQVVAICQRDGSATIASVRNELGTSRKYAQAVLEHMDAEKITLRRDDLHVLRRR